MINVAHDTNMMQGGTLDGRSFTKGADPKEELEEHEGKHEGKHSTNKNTSHMRQIDEHKGKIQDPNPTKDDTKITGSSP